jgi:hypothetical protein
MCLINKIPPYKEIWESKGIAPLFLTSALDSGEWAASRLWRLSPKERAAGTH